uniref:Uncharacterized protein n=1 Tax=Glossina palpalis gambiensis TaxID=67801 RepID=A0A1B0BS38_9MUSC
MRMSLLSSTQPQILLSATCFLACLPACLLAGGSLNAAASLKMLTSCFRDIFSTQLFINLKLNN